MRTKRFIAKDMRQAIKQIGRDLGPEAVILSNTKVNGGIEVIATAEYEDEMFRQQFSNPNDRYNFQNIEAKSAEVSQIKSDTQVNKIIPTESESQSSQELIPDTNKLNNVEYLATQNSSLLDIQNEISDLKDLMEQQLSGLAWGDAARRHPLRIKLFKHLMELNLSPLVCKEIIDQIPDDINITEAWKKSIAILIKKIPTIETNVLEKNQIITLVGPTGVGKTTTIAKLAARYALQHGCKNIALITTDCFRIGAHEQLRTYARILDIPIYPVSSGKELTNAINLVKDKDLVLVDSAGMSHRDQRLENQLNMLGNISLKKKKSFLVLSAATQYESLKETIKTFNNNIDGCILTKIDEAASLGAVISNVVECRLPIAYISDGQRVPEDIHNTSSEGLVNRCVSLMRETDSLEESIEKILWSRSVNANV